MQRIIGITGLKRSGKDTIAEYLQDHYNYKIFRFADPIKDIIENLLIYMRFSPKQIIKYTEQQKEVLIPGLFSSWRQLAQGIGNSWGREMIDQNVWVNILAEASKYYNKVVISDVRYNNEAAWIKDQNPNNIIIKVERDLCSNDGHISEAGINEQFIDKIIYNNDELKDLYYEINLIEGL